MSDYDRSKRSAVALAFAAVAAIAPARVSAQAPMLAASWPMASVTARAAVPYGVGEELTYKATSAGFQPVPRA